MNCMYVYACSLQYMQYNMAGYKNQDKNRTVDLQLKWWMMKWEIMIEIIGDGRKELIGYVKEEIRIAQIYFRKERYSINHLRLNKKLGKGLI